MRVTLTGTVEIDPGFYDHQHGGVTAEGAKYLSDLLVNHLTDVQVTISPDDVPSEDTAPPPDPSERPLLICKYVNQVTGRPCGFSTRSRPTAATHHNAETGHKVVKA